MAKKKIAKKAKTLEDTLKSSMGKKYNNVSSVHRQVIHEMSQCQKMGGPIGSAAIYNYD
ncbi:MAG: hypothetical protein KAX15_01890 [Candidatus Omnitrophica bacterium]|nr:hypothetical protein [Candidatus Omnitrophota bacterium]